MGAALFYAGKAGMKAFYKGHHPRMVEFLGDAMHAYAQQTLR
ncbi:hypothetical protein [Acidovorax sp. SUPP3334]|nr:hypothetical protein [Acidovorax sp. SUPP3334]GKT24861.1 hypothetical protein AVHM3334_16100 [Acidovorax sp. SUPP3334]